MTDDELPPLDPALLDVPAVAQILGTTTSFVIDQAKSGNLTAQRRGALLVRPP